MASASIIDQEEYKYERMNAKHADGRKVRSLNNGDAVSRALFGMDRAAINACLKLNGMGTWVKTSAKLNAGQHRMIAGNMLRARVRGGVVMTVGAYTVKTLGQKAPSSADAFASNTGKTKVRKAK